MTNPSFSQFDHAVEKFAERIRPGSKLSGREYADANLEVYRALQSVVRSLSSGKPEDRPGAPGL
jgi:hypothetical protein